MATERALHNYPQIYFDLFKQAIESPVEVKYDTPREAINARGRLYAFRNAIRSNSFEVPRLAVMVDTIELEVNNSTLTITTTEHRCNGKP